MIFLLPFWIRVRIYQARAWKERKLEARRRAFWTKWHLLRPGE